MPELKKLLYFENYFNFLNSYIEHFTLFTKTKLAKPLQ